MKNSFAQPFRVLSTDFYLTERNNPMIDFTKIDYLKSGTDKQKRVYKILSEHRILEKLELFDPILTGTIPINIDTGASDLDIICCFADAGSFEAHLIASFNREENFKIFAPKHPGSVSATFTLEGFVIEIFGQSIPTREQNAFRHMVVEYKILLEKGEAFRKEIIALKESGYKTEPAFGKLLGLTGNVYEEILKLKS